MVPSRGVDYQYLGSDPQGAYRLLEQGSFPEGEQGGQVRPASGSAARRPGQQATAVGDGGPGEPCVTDGTGPLDPLEADEAASDPQQGCRRLPAFRGQLPQGLLEQDQLVGGGRPGRHADSVRRALRY